MGLHCVSSGSIDPTIWTARSGRRAAPSDRRTQSWRSPGRGSRYARGAAAPSRRHPRSGRTAHRALCEGSTHTHGRRAARDGHVDWMMARGGGGRVGTDASTGGRDLRDQRQKAKAAGQGGRDPKRTPAHAHIRSCRWGPGLARWCTRSPPRALPRRSHSQGTRWLASARPATQSARRGGPRAMPAACASESSRSRAARRHTA